MVYIIRTDDNRKSTLAPQLEIVNEENIGRVDYAIKALEELICITGEKLQYSWICAEFNPTQKCVAS